MTLLRAQFLDPQTQVLAAGFIAVLIGFLLDSDEWFLVGLVIALVGAVWFIFRKN
ncbi:hypothetical protein HUU53_00045 [Candidatus Micrarchaeota archaeon]|nr:hypothetical protein [Candidatus Micrarchaeota archaeon]